MEIGAFGIISGLLSDFLWSLLQRGKQFQQEKTTDSLAMLTEKGSDDITAESTYSLTEVYSQLEGISVGVDRLQAVIGEPYYSPRITTHLYLDQDQPSWITMSQFASLQMQNRQKMEEISRRLSDLEDTSSAISGKLEEISRIVNNIANSLLSLESKSLPITKTKALEGSAAIEDEDLTDVSSLFDEIADMYEMIGDREAIRNFLEEHQCLYPILGEAKEEIISLFGKSAKTCIELQRDPEEGGDEFFIVVKSEHSAVEAVRLENKIAEEWLFSKAREIRDNLNIISE